MANCSLVLVPSGLESNAFAYYANVRERWPRSKTDNNARHCILMNGIVQSGFVIVEMQCLQILHIGSAYKSRLRMRESCSI